MALASAPTCGNDEANEIKAENVSDREESSSVIEEDVEKHSGVYFGLSGFAGAGEEAKTPVDNHAKASANTVRGVNEDGPYHANVNPDCDPCADEPGDP